MTTTCNENECPIATKPDRKAQAEALYATGKWTMEAIAKLQGVTKQAVSKWLSELSTPLTTESRVSKRGRKGEGRPKGSKKPRSAPKRSDKAAQVVALSDTGMSDNAVATATGLKPREVRREVEREAIEREAQAQIDPATLSLTAQQKLDAAMRQQQRAQNLEFEKRVLAEVDRRLNEVVLPAWIKRVDRAEAILRRDKGILTTAEYKLLRSCMHPDRVEDASLKRKFAEAFSILEKLEKFLCVTEKEPPSKFPRTWKEAQSSVSEGRVNSHVE